MADPPFASPISILHSSHSWFDNTTLACAASITEPGVEEDISRALG